MTGWKPHLAQKVLKQRARVDREIRLLVQLESDLRFKDLGMERLEIQIRQRKEELETSRVKKLSAAMRRRLGNRFIHRRHLPVEFSSLPPRLRQLLSPQVETEAAPPDSLE